MPEPYQDTLKSLSAEVPDTLLVNGSHVTLPPDAERPFQVFVNGVPKQEGVDFEVHGGTLVFAEQLVPPHRMTLKTYARLMFWGRYKTEHSVDLVYTRSGAQAVANGLEIEPPPVARPR
jgi:hypothetical protein